MTFSPATEWSRIFIRELYAWGVRDVVVSPGSRSQALALAALEWEQFTDGELQVHVVIDERSAAFRALGLALEAARPAVCIATSGSAPGHYLPAVMEAYHAGVPLVVVSADRPEELLGVGANQTTTHEGLFGIFAQTTSFAAPEVIDEEQIVERVGAVLNDVVYDSAPAHINVAFREPLSGEAGSPLVIPNSREPMRIHSAPVIVTLDPAVPTLVIAGHGAGSEAEEIAHALGAPLVAEAVSGAHFGPHLVLSYRDVLNEGDPFLGLERVVTFGRPTLSREVWSLLSNQNVEHIAVYGRHAEPPNPTGNATLVHGVEVPIPATAEQRSAHVKPWIMAGRRHHDAALAGIIPGAPGLDAVADSDPAARNAFAKAEIEVMRRPVTRESLALAVWEATWPHDRLVVGASRMARVLDRIAGPKKIKVYSNRGLAGIDGTVSTARGVAQAALRAGDTGVTRVLLGDLAFLHDASSLMREPGVDEVAKVHIVVANDGGGTIFDTLEVRQSTSAEAFDRVLYTPHTVDLEALARAYGWDYVAVSTMSGLTEALARTDTHLVVDVSLPRD